MVNQIIKWWEPSVGKKEINYLKKVINTNYTNEGLFSQRLEKKIKKIIGSKYAITTTSGTIAIFLALKAIGVNKNDEVIVPNITLLLPLTLFRLLARK